MATRCMIQGLLYMERDKTRERDKRDTGARRWILDGK